MNFFGVTVDSKGGTKTAYTAGAEAGMGASLRHRTWLPCRPVSPWPHGCITCTPRQVLRSRMAPKPSTGRMMLESHRLRAMTPNACTEGRPWNDWGPAATRAARAKFRRASPPFRRVFAGKCTAEPATSPEPRQRTLLSKPFAGKVPCGGAPARRPGRTTGGTESALAEGRRGLSGRPLRAQLTGHGSESPSIRGTCLERPGWTEKVGVSHKGRH